MNARLESLDDRVSREEKDHQDGREAVEFQAKRVHRDFQERRDQLDQLDFQETQDCQAQEDFLEKYSKLLVPKDLQGHQDFLDCQDFKVDAKFQIWLQPGVNVNFQENQEMMDIQDVMEHQEIKEMKEFRVDLENLDRKDTRVLMGMPGSQVRLWLKSYKRGEQIRRVPAWMLPFLKHLVSQSDESFRLTSIVIKTLKRRNQNQNSK